MNEVIITSTFLKLGMALIAVLLVWVVLRILDSLSGFEFARWMNEAEKTEPVAVAIYLGARVLGACVLVGYLFS